METNGNKPKISLLSSIKTTVLLWILLSGGIISAEGQCLSAINPIGGSQNLLVLEKNTLRVITFYRYHYGNRYFSGDSPASFKNIRYAGYNYAGTIVGYGLSGKVTLEGEWGYFINKTQIYRGEPERKMKGSGFPPLVVSLKGSLLKDDINRLFISASGGAKVPLRRELQVRDGALLPMEVQPSSGAWGAVAQFFVVKEKPVSGSRYFFTARMESNARNREDYRLGNALYTSLFYSKHLMFPWLKGDWTAIVQLRNELRGRDTLASGTKESSGGQILYLSPQINTTLAEKWNLSLTMDLPLYQHFHGTQMSSRCGFAFNLARDFPL
jgi:hypothetical protein